jgi:hypothetical protein
VMSGSGTDLPIRNVRSHGEYRGQSGLAVDIVKKAEIDPRRHSAGVSLVNQRRASLRETAFPIRETDEPNSLYLGPSAGGETLSGATLLAERPISPELLRKTRFAGTAWWAREDSNRQPDRYPQHAAAPTAGKFRIWRARRIIEDGRRKDWHSPANRALVSSSWAKRLLRDPAPPA